MGEQFRRWMLVGLCGMAFALRAVGLGFQSLWRDEVDAIRFATEALGDLLRKLVEPGQNGPLYYLLLRPWLDQAGQSEFSLRFFSVFFGVLSVPLLYRLARRLFPSLPFIGLVGAILATTSPYLVWYSQEGKMYALTVTLVLLSMDRYLLALERGGWQRWLSYVFITSVAFYVHLIAALMVPAQIAIFFLLGRERCSQQWKPWLASTAALTVPYLPLLVWQVPLLLETGTTGYDFVPLPDMLFSLWLSYSHGVVQEAAWWSVALFAGLLLAAGLLLGRREGLAASLGFLLCWLLVPLLGFFFVTLIHPLYTARYLVFVLPAYLLLLAAGMVAVARRSRFLAGLLLLVVLVANGWGLWLQARTPLKADFRSATDYLTSRSTRDDLLLFQIPYGRHSFEYYSQRLPASRPGTGVYRLFLPLLPGRPGERYRWAEGLYTNGGMDPAEVDRRMAEMTAGSRVVWLVATEVPLWDERNLVKGWLDEHAERTEEARFVRVTLYRYEFP